MSASKAPVRGTKSGPTDAEPDGPQLVSELLAEQITPICDPEIDSTLLQSEGHRPRWGGLGQDRQSIARNEARARIRRYFEKVAPC